MDVRVVGLFNERAVVLINGKQHILKAGQTTREGVKLISADSESANLDIGGKMVKATLDGRVSARKRMAGEEALHISRNSRGMYTTPGSINGLTVSFLIDTGADRVAMNAAEARRLGIDFRATGVPVWIATASRVEMGWDVNLDSVKVGELELQNIEAVVLEGTQPPQVLLGMSYLSQLEMTAGHLMTLRKLD